jgi:hypothetical protein
MSKIGYHNTVIDLLTGIGQEATITVYDTETSNLSSIFSDSTGSAKNNPFTTDQYGRFSFFADLGVYDIQISGLDIETYKLTGVSIMGISSPPLGKYPVKNLYVDPDSGRLMVEYEDTPN